MLDGMESQSSEDAVALVENRSVAGDGIFSDAQDDIILLEHLFRAGNRKQTINAGAEVIVWQLEHAPISGVLESHNPNARLGKAIVTPIRNVLQKMPNDRG